MHTDQVVVSPARDANQVQHTGTKDLQALKSTSGEKGVTHGRDELRPLAMPGETERVRGGEMDPFPSIRMSCVFTRRGRVMGLSSSGSSSKMSSRSVFGGGGAVVVPPMDTAANTERHTNKST